MGLYALLNHLNLTNGNYLLKLKAPQTTGLLSRLHPQDFIHRIIILKNVLLHHMLCCSFMFVLLPCSNKKKSRVIKFWGFFMYLLFLGIVQNNAMKLDSALTRIGKLCFREKTNIEWHDMLLFLASYRGRSTDTGSLTFRILCKCDD